MAVTVVRYQAKPDRADENQALVEAVYAELAASRPDGFRYATFRMDDGVTFVHVATNDRADGSNPLASSAAFAAFQAGIADRVDVAPIALTGSMVGSYGWPGAEG